MTITVDAIKRAFIEHRYELTRETIKVIEFRSPVADQYLYVNKERDLESTIHVIIDPRIAIEGLLRVSGVRSPGADHLQHSSNLRQFPKRRNRGELEIHYGRPLAVSSLEALDDLLGVYDRLGDTVAEGEMLPPRITAIALQNFKGIGERDKPMRIELAPITLLFGANSAGKSTILQSLLYLREILERRNTNPDRTLHGGAFVDFGGFQNLVHKHDLSRVVGIQVEMALNRDRLPDLMTDRQSDSLSGDADLQALEQTLQAARERVVSVGIGLKIRWSTNRQQAVIAEYVVGTNGSWVARLTSNDDGRDVQLALNEENEIFVRYLTQNEIDESLESEGEREGSASIDMRDRFDRGDSEDDYAHSELPAIIATLAGAGLTKMGTKPEEYDGFRAFLSGFDGALPNLNVALAVPAIDGETSTSIAIAREFTAFLSSLLVGSALLIRNELRRLRYLGPIRNIPDRNFTAMLSPDESHWADGTAAWEMLQSADEKLVSVVSEWMSADGKLRTGYELVRTQIKEIDAGTLTHLLRALDGAIPPHGLLEAAGNLPEKVKLSLVEVQSGLRLQPRDVGIGISQLLPVVVAALEPSAGLVVIEQPELHIHPAVQVGLGDLFARAAADNGSVFLIETHSEHLILRLLRRIRETTEGELPPGLLPLRPEQVAVFYVERDEVGVKLTALPIDAAGEFKSKWPSGFFEERATELF